MRNPSSTLNKNEFIERGDHQITSPFYKNEISYVHYKKSKYGIRVSPSDYGMLQQFWYGLSALGLRSSITLIWCNNCETYYIKKEKKLSLNLIILIATVENLNSSFSPL